MTINSSALGKLLGHEPVDPLDVPGRVIQNLDAMPPPKPVPAEKPKASEPVRVKTEAEKLEEKRARQREYNRRYKEKIRAQQHGEVKTAKPAELPKPVEPAQFEGLNIDHAHDDDTKPEEQRFDVYGPAAFKIAQALFERDLLTCSLVIDAENRLSFVFSLKGKS